MEPNKKLPVTNVPALATQLDAVASQAAEAFLSPTQNVATALAVAEGIEQMRSLLETPEIKRRIMALQDTRLGFKTDRDPRVKNKKSQDFNTPYPWESVRECALEALLRGVTLCGNQFNIIAHGTYLTREGFQYKLRKVPGFADLKPVIGVPRTAAGGAVIHCEATWTLNRRPDSLVVDIAAKGDDYTGTDGYIGKAERKFFKRIYEIVTGNTSDPEGDAAETPAMLPGPKITRPALEVPNAPSFLPAPPPVEKPNQSRPEVGGQNLVLALRRLCRHDDVEEAEVIREMVASGMDQSLTSFEEVAIVDRSRLQHVHDNWGALVTMLKARKATS